MIDRWQRVRHPVLIFCWFLLLGLAHNWGITVVAAFALTVNISDLIKARSAA